MSERVGGGGVVVVGQFRNNKSSVLYTHLW